MKDKLLKVLGTKLGIDWNKVDFEQFKKGYKVELEHGSKDTQTNVTNNDPIKTGKITWAHLKELPDYYNKLERVEKKANQPKRNLLKIASKKILYGSF